MADVSSQSVQIIRKDGTLEPLHCGFSRQLALKVGDAGDGIKTMSDVSLITVGDALGHGILIDQKTIEQGAELMKGRKLRSYITHDGAMWGDRLTREIGSFSGIYVDGDQLKAETFKPYKAFVKHNEAQYDALFELAEDMPEDWGISIVPEGYLVWPMSSGDELPYRYGDDKPEGAITDKPVLRLTSIFSADFVDAPAANPRGLFRADGNNKPNTGDKTMADATDKELLALSKQVNELKDSVADFKAQLKAKEDEITALGEAHKVELKAERDRINEVLTLGREHGQEELALKSVADGDQVGVFTKKLLGAYKGGLSKEDGNADVGALSIDVEPKTREQFLGTYKAEQKKNPAKATTYFNKHKAKFNK